MPSNSPGRGLRDISDVFLTNKKKVTQNGKKGAPAPYPSLGPHRHCDTCIHFISACADPTCRIFTFDFERYKVPYMAKIDPLSATSCRYYQSRQSHEDPTGLSSADGVEIEDTVQLTRKMVIKKNADMQKNIRRILFEYMEQGYDITRIVMEKHCNKDTQQMHNITHTKVDVFVEEDRTEPF